MESKLATKREKHFFSASSILETEIPSAKATNFARRMNAALHTSAAD